MAAFQGYLYDHTMIRSILPESSTLTLGRLTIQQALPLYDQVTREATYLPRLGEQLDPIVKHMRSFVRGMLVI